MQTEHNRAACCSLDKLERLIKNILFKNMQYILLYFHIINLLLFFLVGTAFQFYILCVILDHTEEIMQRIKWMQWNY